METEKSNLKGDPKASRLKELLPNMPEPCPALKLFKVVGEGTFSTVYLVKREKSEQDLENVDNAKRTATWRRWYAVKHLIPTSSPERILMEVECLRLSNGRKNVVPLLFCHRIRGDVILVMPYIENNKFNEVIRTMDHVEMKAYMKNLLLALSHIHSLGIIHRDIKPANFLYDRQRRRYGLVDFGLAQRGQPPMSSLCNVNPPMAPECKRKLGSSDLPAEDQEPHTPTQNKRVALEDRTQQETNTWQRITRKLSTPRTPTSTEQHKPTPYYYDKRGCLLKDGSPTRKPINHRNRLKTEEPEPSNINQEQADNLDEDQNMNNSLSLTPKKNKTLEVAQSPTLRRSPRKLSSAGNNTFQDIHIPMQPGSVYDAWKLPRRSPRKHPSTLEVLNLKPPSTLCPGVRPVTSGTKVGHTDISSQGGRNPAGYSKLTISGSAIVSNFIPGQTSAANLTYCDNTPTQSTPNASRQVSYTLQIG